MLKNQKFGVEIEFTGISSRMEINRRARERPQKQKKRPSRGSVTIFGRGFCFLPLFLFRWHYRYDIIHFVSGQYKGLRGFIFK